MPTAGSSQIQKLARRFKGFLNDREGMPENIRPENINPENFVWIFGTARTGSTWLSRILGGLPKHVVWNEPLVGEIFGSIMYPSSRWEFRRKRGNFIMGEQHRKVYLNSIRNFTLDGAASRFPRATSRNYIVIKEPHGSLGSPLLMQAFRRAG